METTRRPSFLSRLRAQVVPSPQTLTASVLLAVVAGVLWAWRAADLVVPAGPAQSWQAQLPNLLVAVVAGLVVAIVLALVAALARRRVPWLLIAVWVASAFLLATMGAGAAIRGWWVIVAVVLVAVPLLGMLLGSFLRGRPSGKVLVAGAAAAVVLLVVGAFLVWPGPSAPAVPAAGARGTTGEPAAGDVPDPTATGSFQVETLRYGTDGDVRTTPVDASDVISGWTPAQTAAWGFDATQLPLEATVWRPQAPGRHPLVLIVHGNNVGDDAELGYAYLAETLASRGYVVAAIDENFLNTSVLSTGVGGMDEARIWLIQQHLELWRSWDSPQAGSPLAGVVDLAAVALVGHSRGGEAVAAAAQQGEPGAVRTVVTIAPSDGILRPRDLVALQGVSYLTIAGSYDADIFFYAGAQQLARVRPADGTIAAGVLMDRMNHSQFNSRWGSRDGATGLAKYVLGTGVLVPPQEQQRAALGYISAFLDLTVKGDAAYRPMFDGSAPAPDFVPVAVRQQFRSAGTVPLQPGAAQGAEAETVPLPGRVGPTTHDVLRLTGAGQARLPLQVPPNAGAVTALRVHLADGAPAGAGTHPEIRVRLTDAAGGAAELPLGADGQLAAQLPGQFTKLGVLMPAAAGEAALHTYTVPAAAMTAAGLDPSRITGVELLVDAPGENGVFLAEPVLVTG